MYVLFIYKTENHRPKYPCLETKAMEMDTTRNDPGGLGTVKLGGCEEHGTSFELNNMNK